MDADNVEKSERVNERVNNGNERELPTSTFYKASSPITKKVKT